MGEETIVRVSVVLRVASRHVKQSYESSEEEREDGEALLVTWRPRVDALSRKQWRRRKRRRNRLMAASRTRDAIATARCGLRCVASLVFVRLVKAGDVELNPGPRDKLVWHGLPTTRRRAPVSSQATLASATCNE